MRCAALLLCLSAVVTAKHGPLRGQFGNRDRTVLQNGVDPGAPLFLTPYIEAGQISTAQQLSLVSGLPSHIESYAGFLTVNKKYNSNLFFWFFPAEQDPDNAPVALWLQGGPGGSSMFGLFVENGPFTIDKDLNLNGKPFTWNTKYSMIYIDNPVGTGFSFTDFDQGYSTTEPEVADNLYSALTQFFVMFPKLADNDFYLTGESYAGKYIPAVGYKILQEGNRGVNLKGAAIGDGFTDPVTMLPEYSSFLYNIGLLDENQRAYFSKQSDIAVKLINKGDYLQALAIWDSLLNSDFSTSKSYFYNVTELSDYYNYLRPQSPEEFNYYEDWLQIPQVRKSIHVGNLTYNGGTKVEQHLAGDMLQSQKTQLAALMDNYKVLVYSGVLDIIVALPLTEAMLQTVQWSGLEQYKNATRQVWKVNPTDVDVAGYVRQVKNFYQVAVRGGGHILPYDQPERSFDMIDRFFTGRPFA